MQYILYLCIFAQYNGEENQEQEAKQICEDEAAQFDLRDTFMHLKLHLHETFPSYLITLLSHIMSSLLCLIQIYLGCGLTIM